MLVSVKPRPSLAFRNSDRSPKRTAATLMALRHTKTQFPFEEQLVRAFGVLNRVVRRRSGVKVHARYAFLIIVKGKGERKLQSIIPGIRKSINSFCNRKAL